MFLVVLAAHSQQDWYIPKRTEVGKSGTGEISTRFLFSTDSGGLFELRSRRLDLIPGFRYAVSERLELYSELPFSEVESERLVGGTFDTDRGFGIGDAFVQVSSELASGEDWRLLSSFDLLMPTGRDPFDNKVGTGGGFYRTGGGITAMKVVDPVNMFLYAGYQYGFDNQFDIGTVDPGDSFRFRYGIAVALNPKIRLTISVSGDISSVQKLDGDVAFGSSADLVRLDVGTEWSLGKSTILQLDTIFGITDEAQDLLLSIGIGCALGS